MNIPKISKKDKIVLVRKVHTNSTTGQASITIPKKFFKKFFKKVPKEVKITW